MARGGPARSRWIYAAAAAFACLWLALVWCQWSEFHRSARSGTDFFVYLIAVGRAWKGEDPYLPHNIGWGFFYPPPALLLVAALRSLSWSAAAPAIAFQVASGLALVVALALMGASRSPWRIFVALLLLTSGAVLETVYIGQINAFVVLLLAFAWWGWSRSRDPTAATGIAGAIVLKATPVFFLVLLCRKRGLPALLGCVVVVALLLGLSEWMIPAPHLTRSFLDAFAWSLEQSPRFNEWNYSLSSALPGLLQSNRLTPNAVQAAKLIVLALLLALAAAACQRRPEQRAGRRALFVACNLATVLAPTIVWLHHATLLIPAMWLLLTAERSRLTRALALLAALGFQATRCVQASGMAAPGWSFAGGEVLLLIAGARCVAAAWFGDGHASSG